MSRYERGSAMSPNPVPWTPEDYEKRAAQREADAIEIRRVGDICSLACGDADTAEQDASMLRSAAGLMALPRCPTCDRQDDYDAAISLADQLTHAVMGLGVFEPEQVFDALAAKDMALAEAQQEIERLRTENAVLVKAIEFDPEPDLPEDECTTPAMLYKIAIQWDTLLEIAQQNPNNPQFVADRVKELVATHQWSRGLRSRADFLEKRARREYIAESSLTAERQQVTALREFVRDNYKILLKKMDSLGLTGTAPAKEKP